MPICCCALTDWPLETSTCARRAYTGTVFSMLNNYDVVHTRYDCDLTNYAIKDRSYGHATCSLYLYTNVVLLDVLKDRVSLPTELGRNNA